MLTRWRGSLSGSPSLTLEASAVMGALPPGPQTPQEQKADPAARGELPGLAAGASAARLHSPRTPFTPASLSAPPGWQVLVAGPSGKRSFTRAVAGPWQGGLARHQGPEWMLGELAAGTHGGPFHRPLDLHMHRPCDRASYQQRTCSPTNARVLPQSGGPTPLQPLQEFSPRPGPPQPCLEVLKPSIKIHC